ncbi:hypothetical protein CC2G_003673 [Coprinopsis cinerea AmutBmut pab1-1]|nr:hypothetical protein CC2G_003673 [Coprinopsis cinerea AmutBmut pab1-1]
MPNPLPCRTLGLFSIATTIVARTASSLPTQQILNNAWNSRTTRPSYVRVTSCARIPTLPPTPPRRLMTLFILSKASL